MNEETRPLVLLDHVSQDFFISTRVQTRAQKAVSEIKIHVFLIPDKKFLIAAKAAIFKEHDFHKIFFIGNLISNNICFVVHNDIGTR